jgi:phosphatidylinositol-3-phosphatase
MVSLMTSSAGAWTVRNALSPTTSPYVVVIMLENRPLHQVYGSTCLGNCSYITQLADTYGLAESYSAIGHGSLQNYLDITSGGNYDYAPFSNDCFPQSPGCSLSGSNIVDSLESSGLSWKAYMEDYTGGGCTRHHNNDTQNAYENGHDPFLYYSDIFNSPSRCSRIVDANPGFEGYLALPSVLLSDLNSVSTSSNLMWLTPNQCDNAHSTCTTTASNVTSCPSTSLPQCVSQANKYLSVLVPQILNSPVFQTENAALFITFDEGTQIYPRDYVAAIWAGPMARTGFKSSLAYSHYSLLRTLEALWNLPATGSYDASASFMTEFLTTPPIFPGGSRFAT